jgi:catechol 2,3-dioxygenase-like lactoylglutathione lyase family enzyme
MNAAGVSMGHLHLNVKDIEESKKFWVDQLGATTVKLGNSEVMKIPGVLVFLKKAEPAGGADGSVVNHIGCSRSGSAPHPVEGKLCQVRLGEPCQPAGVHPVARWRQDRDL